MNIYIDGFYKHRMKCDEYLGADEKSYFEMIDSYRAEGCSCQPVLGSDHVLDIRDNEGTNLIATCIDEDEDLEMDPSFMSNIYNVGSNRIQVVFDPESELLLSYRYTDKENSEKSPVLKLVRDPYLEDHSIAHFLYKTCQKLGIKEQAFEKEPHIIPLYYILDCDYRIEIISDNISYKYIMSLYNASKPGKMKEIVRIDRGQYDLSDHDLFAIFMPQIRSLIN